MIDTWIASGARALFQVSVQFSSEKKKNAVTTEFPPLFCGCVLHSPGLPTFNIWIRGTQRLKTRGGTHPKALPWKCGNDLGVCKAVSNRQPHNIITSIPERLCHFLTCRWPAEFFFFCLLILQCLVLVIYLLAFWWVVSSGRRQSST